jgi:hypothetical protein
MLDEKGQTISFIKHLDDPNTSGHKFSLGENGEILRYAAKQPADSPPLMGHLHPQSVPREIFPLEPPRNPIMAQSEVINSEMVQ